MLLENFKKYAISELRGTVILMVTLFVALGTVFHFNYRLIDERKNLDQEVSELKRRLSNIKNATQKSKKILGVWSNLDRSLHSKREGIKVEKASKIIKRLQEENQITDLNISFSNPKLRADREKKDKFSEVQHSEVNMEFQAYTDVHAFTFMKDIISNLEGHIHIKLFQITADPLNKVILKGLKNGTVKKMVAVKMNFLWHQIKDKKTEKTKKDSKSV